jgi:hypothetical protein
MTACPGPQPFIWQKDSPRESRSLNPDYSPT